MHPKIVWPKVVGGLGGGGGGGGGKIVNIVFSPTFRNTTIGNGKWLPSLSSAVRRYFCSSLLLITYLKVEYNVLLITINSEFAQL